MVMLTMPNVINMIDWTLVHVYQLCPSIEEFWSAHIWDYESHYLYFYIQMYMYTLPYPWLFHLHVHACPRMLYIFVTNLVSFLETLSDVIANTKCHQLHACIDYNTCSCTWNIAVHGI